MWQKIKGEDWIKSLFSALSIKFGYSNIAILIYLYNTNRHKHYSQHKYSGILRNSNLLYPFYFNIVKS